MQYHFKDKCIGYLHMLLNIFSHRPSAMMEPSKYFLIFSKKTESSELPVGCLNDIEVEKATMNYL